MTCWRSEGDSNSRYGFTFACVARPEKVACSASEGFRGLILNLLDRFWQVIYWPLKRHLFVVPFKVIARVGSTGNDERILEPNDNPKSNNLEAIVIPRRDGELFLYVNDAVWAHDWTTFYKDNSGSATIAVSRADD